MLTPPRRDMRSHWNPLHFAVTFGNWLCWCKEGYCTECVLYTPRTKKCTRVLIQVKSDQKILIQQKRYDEPNRPRWSIAEGDSSETANPLQLTAVQSYKKYTDYSTLCKQLGNNCTKGKNKPVCLSFVFSQKAQAMFWFINKIWTQPKIIFMATGNFSTLKLRAVENETCHMVLYYSIIKAGFTILKSKYHQSD